MRVKINRSYLLLLLSVLFYSCEKELSIEGNKVTGTAVFTFAGSPAACTVAIPAGTFEAGTALGATNTVTISVEVSTIGTYAIATNASNGILFSGTGEFTNLGPQTIILTGTGTPIAAGTFSFTPGTNGCSFPITIASGGGGSGSAVYTFGGAPGACTGFTPAGTYTAGVALDASNTATVTVDVDSLGTYTISTNTVNGISFSGSGTFTILGQQTVVLSGTGTPVAEGVFDLTPGSNGCTFSLTIGPGTGTGDFLTCDIDGVSRTFNTDLVADNSDPANVFIVGSETGTLATMLLSLTNTPAVTTGTYEKLSATNTTTFCVGGYDDGVAPAAWSIGILLQPGGFSVTVTSITATRIEGTFSGTLYDNDGQGSGEKVITNGQFSVAF